MRPPRVLVKSYSQLELRQDVGGQDEGQVEQLTGGQVEVQPAGVVVGRTQSVTQRPRRVQVGHPR